jgi:hypothetical protein
MKSLFALALLSAWALAVANTAMDIATQESRISVLRKEVEPLVAPLQSIKSDVRVFASFEPIVAAVAGLNALPAAQRTISLQSTAASGHFYENNGLCNSYVELQGPGELHAAGTLTAFNATTQEDGSLLFSAHADTSGHVLAHWQFLGVRVRGPLGIGNVCPPGGGVGDNIGANFEKGLDFNIRVGFAMTADGQTVTYQASIINPRKVDVTIGLEVPKPIGTVGFPTSFEVPGGAIASGQFPLLIAAGGKVVLPGEKGPRTYALALKPVSFAVTKAGAAAEWNSVIDFETSASTR